MGASQMALVVKNPPASEGNMGWEHSLRRQWQPTPVILPVESRGQRNLAGYSP